MDARSKRVGPDVPPPSPSWAYKFSKSLDGYKIVNSQPISIQKAVNATPERIEQWFEAATSQVRPTEVRPELLFNMDETMLSSTPKKIRVLVPRDSEGVQLTSNDSEGLHITVVFCVSADGGHLKPTLILPMKEFPLGLAPSATHFNWSGQSAEWMTAEIFREWVVKAFIPYVNARRTELNCPNERALLMVDGHESRRSVEALRALSDANIDVFTFPSHTSHILQPMDCGINRAFKTKLNAQKSAAIRTTVDERRTKLVELAARASYDAMYPGTVKEAWRTAGIWPWSLEQMKSSKYVLRQVPPEIAQLTPKRKRSRISLSGKLISGEDVISALEAKEEEQKAREAGMTARKRKRAERPPSDDSSHE